jgi:superfamily II DNA or RNA helicase/diadenosine tetraphosphate (Ap4A) HIT family hydrolase/HKD family nuclease
MGDDHDPGSPFLSLPATAWLASNDLAFAIFDRFPVSDGHTLVVPRRLVASWWEATEAEQHALLNLAEQAKQLLEDRYAPDGWNLGVNIGRAAGQTVDHLHLHLIPRYDGDVADPRGGIRHAIPSRGNWQTLGAEAAAGYDTPDAGVRLFDGVHRPLGVQLTALLRDPGYDRLDVAVAFALPSGVEVVAPALADGLERGLKVRLLTSDYLDVTDPRALAQLLDLAAAFPHQLHLKVAETARARGFHAKAYLFSCSRGDRAACMVGSSNLTRAALETNVEWNVQVDRLAAFTASFERLWTGATWLDHGWVDSYRARRRALPAGVARPAAEVVEEPQLLPEPRPHQREALEELAACRAEGHRTGLVVMATGLGKTWLAAFDTADATHTLFIAHREEILQQSLEVFRQVQPDRRLGLATGAGVDLDAEVVFASVQWLHRNLERIPPEWFDRVVVDEFHHAAARSYRKVLDHLRPRFLLGLTATPERLDGADLLALTGDNLVIDIGLVEGIERRQLVPFHYLGIRDDTVDYSALTWRAGRFDEVELTRAVSTDIRAEHVLEQWRAHGGGRTLAFCVTTDHADFMAEAFATSGVRAAAVHTAPTSAPRRGAIEQLAAGALDVVFSVDLFNEGLDVPTIDTVLLLRPTQSPVVFLQQLGRGLRPSDGKHRLTVLDLIGNHRAFLDRPRLLLELFGEREPDPARALALLREGIADLPAGCAIEVDLATVELLESLRARARRNPLEEYLVARTEETGERPTAVQCLRAGFNPASLRRKGAGWFDRLDELGVLTDEERTAVEAAGPFLRRIERESITKSFKLLTLRAITRRGWLWTPAPIDELAEEVRDALLADPRLLRDVADETSPDPADARTEVWRAYMRKNPIAAWAGEMRADPSSAPFALVDETLMAKLDVAPEVRPAVEELVAEIVDWRLVRYLDDLQARQQEGAGGRGGPVVAQLKVAQNASGRPILFLRREHNLPLPHGEVEVLIDGQPHTARFVKVACNVLTRPGSDTNVLPEVLRGWFGQDAGATGTHHTVELVAADAAQGWRLRRVDPTA